MKKSVLRVSALAASALATSIATQLQAATFDSNGTGGGVWEDPLSWLPGVGYPDTFAGDSAVIHAGDTINFDDLEPDGDGGLSTPATPFTTVLGVGAGGLAVSNGNSILIDGGVLIQGAANGLVNEIRIGDGAGVTNGTGTLTIDNGGIFASGTSVGVAVGSDINYGGLGNGTVDIKDGLFVMQIYPGVGTAPPPLDAAFPAQLGVGIDGSTGVINVGDGAGAADTAILDLETNGNNMGLGVSDQLGLGSTAGNGTVIVNSDGLLQNGAGSIFVGTEAGGVGLLRINGGRLGNGAVATGEIRIGGDGGTGTLDIRAGSTVNVASEVNVGRNAGGLGTMIMTGGVATVGNLQIGRDSAMANSGTVSGGTLTTLSTWVGRNGNGTLDITGAGTVVNTTGGDGLRIGIDGSSVGEVNIEAGAVFNLQGWTEIGAGSGATGTLNVMGAGTVYNHLEFANDMQVGYRGGTGNVNITDGAKMTTNWWMNIARGAGSIGNVVVDGAGSQLDVGVGSGSETRLIVGEDGTGNMTVSDGGIVNHNSTSAARTHIGQNSGSSGTLSVQTAGQFNTNEMFVGTNGGATGVINITSGGSVTTQDWMEVGSRGGVGTINIDGAGSRLANIGGGDGRNGNRGGDAQIGYAGGNGTINVTNGGIYETGWWLNIARGGGSVGTVNIDGVGSQVRVGQADIVGQVPGVTAGDAKTNIGEDGTGTMTLTNGAEAFLSIVGAEGGHELFVGRNAGSNGTLNIFSNSIVHSNGNWSTIIGQSGTGTVNVDTGGQLLADNWIVIGNEAGSNGTLNLAGPPPAAAGGLAGAPGDSLVESGTPLGGSHEGRFITGRLGTATVNQSGGIARADNWFAIGIDNGGTGTYNMSGGRIELAMPNFGDRNIIVGNNGNGTMNITAATPAGDTIVSTIVDGNFGTTINQFNVGGDSTGTGTLNIDVGAGNRIRHRELYAGWSSNGTASNGTININSGTLETLGWVEVGRGTNNNGGRGTVNVTGPDSVWDRGVTWGLAGGFESRRDVSFGQGEAENVGEGFLNVSNGGTVMTNWWINLARNHLAKGHMTVDGVGSSINIVPHPTEDHNAQTNVGESGVGTLDITNGGVYNHMVETGVGSGIPAGGGEFYIARNSTANGVATVDGAGSALNVRAREFRVGNDGTGAISAGGWNEGEGVLNIQNGGVVNFSSIDEAFNPVNGNFGIAQHNQAKGTVNLNNGTLNISAWSLFGAWEDSAALSVATINSTDSTIDLVNDTGDHGRLLWGRRGTAVINQSGGTFHVGQWAALGVEPGGNGTWNITDGGTATVDAEMVIGSKGTGTLNVSDGTGATTFTVNQHINVGENRDGLPGVGTVNQTSGTVTVNNQWIAIGVGAGSSGTWNISGGLLNASAVGLEVGSDSNGALNITGTGEVRAQNVAVGVRDGSVGVINIDNGLLHSNDRITIGGDQSGGAGTANISGGTVEAATMIVGAGGAVGVANISGGSVTATNRVAIGASSPFQITNYATADTVIAGGPLQAYSFTGNYTTSNTQDNGDAGGPFGLGAQVQGLPAGDNDDFAFVGLGNFTVDTTGSYIFSNDTDDGSRLRISINGGLFTEIITDNVLSGSHTVSSAAQALTAGDTIALDWMWYERGGGAEGESFYSRDGGPNALWEDASQGLTLAGGQYSGTVYKAGLILGDGTVNLTGGVLVTQFVVAEAGTASLSFDGGTLRAIGSEGDFIRGLDGVGTHSAINILNGDGTIDTNGFDVRIKAPSKFANPSDAVIDGLAGAVLVKAGLGRLTIEGQVGDGNLSVDVQAGIMDLESSQTFDAVNIGAGGGMTLSALLSPPAPGADPASVGSDPASVGSDPAAVTYDDLAAGGGGSEADQLAANGGGIQTVPEPGVFSLLAAGLFGLMARRSRSKRD